MDGGLTSSAISPATFINLKGYRLHSDRGLQGIIASMLKDHHPLVVKCFEKAGIDHSALKGSGILTNPSTDESYFTKTGRDVVQMQGEVSSLRAMAITAPPTLVPFVIGFEIENGQAATVCRYLDLTSGLSSATARELGHQLAQMHNVPPDDSCGYTGKYGFEVPTHCGKTQQDNTWEEKWSVFYRERRLGDLVRRIGDGEIIATWNKMLDKAVPLLLEGMQPPPQPVIIHGDLWKGNVGYDRKTSQPVTFDPSSYWGHNEAELGICKMLGGFPPEFFEAYHEVHPKSSPHYEQRQMLYELYHHLNHTLIFGRGYKSSTLSIMRDLIDFADKVA